MISNMTKSSSLLNKIKQSELTACGWDKFFAIVIVDQSNLLILLWDNCHHFGGVQFTVDATARLRNSMQLESAFNYSFMMEENSEF